MILHLVRHGETASYESDAGLTERGIEQARARGESLAAELPDGTAVSVAYAPTARARQTAEVLHATLAGAPGLKLGGNEVAPEFRNLQLRVDGRDYEPTQVRELIPAAGGAGWAEEARRFWQAHEDGDAMGFWLQIPLLWHESPDAVVRRFLAATVAAADRVPADEHLAVATHSGCMRAVVAWAAGRDLGEPDNAEEVVLVPTGGSVAVTYRGETWHHTVPEHA
ncbi:MULTISPECIES: histidine phosphatase family protein [unclassified Amycolatopsis]|uniref:histidine phosphatase family protein n=1 Tax=unclassified Amycolatopsis TaxID=2618356 RepID=UPI0034553ECF